MVDSYTDVSNAIITDPSFLKTLRAKGSQNVPGLVANKQQLEGELLKKNLNQNIINFYLRATQFP